MKVLTKKVRVVESVNSGYGYVKAHYDWRKREPIFQNQHHVWSRDQLQCWQTSSTMMKHSSDRKE